MHIFLLSPFETGFPLNYQVIFEGKVNLLTPNLESGQISPGETPLLLWNLIIGHTSSMQLFFFFFPHIFSPLTGGGVTLKPLYLQPKPPPLIHLGASNKNKCWQQKTRKQPTLVLGFEALPVLSGVELRSSLLRDDLREGDGGGDRSALFRKDLRDGEAGGGERSTLLRLDLRDGTDSDEDRERLSLLFSSSLASSCKQGISSDHPSS